MLPPAESLGPDDGSPVLLIGGATWSRDWWDEIATAPLVERGLRVVRYDHRDTGEAEYWPPGAPGYTGADLTTDALGVLDHLGIRAAHLVGLSMGGGIAQELALHHRERVTGLTLIATTPVDPRITGLPGPDPSLAPGREPDDPVEAIVEGERPCAGPGRFEEDRVRAIARNVVARTQDPASATNHFLVAGDPTPGPDDLGALAGLPVTVVHGSADPVFPLPHGRALAAAIPGAELVIVEGMGHQLPPERDWRGIVGTISPGPR
ncbi:alpha/beta fold hydrolase [Actinomycetospora soli]|uniref:alpha/beta fold hydrolase n=1 Tax=Actinomycetospora soli TaxID=2893887 RepID=UPI001E45D102|nr:alpha/beta fold hydrolase [Actinomycetospora soli]MCD2189895.1 alpha/beta fold hydrolase [Actinomycetospora soli]